MTLPRSTPTPTIAACSAAVACLLALPGVGCARHSEFLAGGRDVAVALPRIDQVGWRCIELCSADGAPRAVTDRPPTLRIGSDWPASGFAGVNRCFAEVTIDSTPGPDQPLRFGPVGTTRMAGPPERMELERAFTEMLGSVRYARIAFERSGPVLTLRNERGTCARFVPEPPDGDGTAPKE